MLLDQTTRTLGTLLIPAETRDTLETTETPNQAQGRPSTSYFGRILLFATELDTHECEKTLFWA